MKPCIPFDHPNKELASSPENQGYPKKTCPGVRRRSFPLALTGTKKLPNPKIRRNTAAGGILFRPRYICFRREREDLAIVDRGDSKVAGSADVASWFSCGCIEHYAEVADVCSCASIGSQGSSWWRAMAARCWGEKAPRC